MTFDEAALIVCNAVKSSEGMAWKEICETVPTLVVMLTPDNYEAMALKEWNEKAQETTVVIAVEQGW